MMIGLKIAVLFLFVQLGLNVAVAQSNINFQISTAVSSELSSKRSFYYQGNLSFIIYEDVDDFYAEFVKNGKKRVLRRLEDLSETEINSDPMITAFYPYFKRALESRQNRDALFTANFEKLKNKWPLGHSYLAELNEPHYLKFYLGNDTTELNSLAESLSTTFHEVFHRRAQKAEKRLENGMRQLIWITPTGPNHLFNIYLPRGSILPSLSVLRKYVQEINDPQLSSLAKNYLSNQHVILNSVATLFEEAKAYSVEYDVLQRFYVSDLTVKKETFHGAGMLELGLKYLKILSETDPQLFEKVHTAEVKSVFESIYHDLRNYYEQKNVASFARAQELARSLGYF